MWGLCLSACRSQGAHQTWARTTADCGPHFTCQSSLYFVEQVVFPRLRGWARRRMLPRVPCQGLSLWVWTLAACPECSRTRPFVNLSLAASLLSDLGKGYFSRLEEDEKLAVPICSLFLKVGSVGFRVSLNISVYKVRPAHLEWKCGARGPSLGFSFIPFIWKVGVLPLLSSSVIKPNCGE